MSIVVALSSFFRIPEDSTLLQNAQTRLFLQQVFMRKKIEPGNKVKILILKEANRSNVTHLINNTKETHGSRGFEMLRKIVDVHLDSTSSRDQDRPLLLIDHQASSSMRKLAKNFDFHQVIFLTTATEQLAEVLMTSGAAEVLTATTEQLAGLLMLRKSGSVDVGERLTVSSIFEKSAEYEAS